MRSFAILIVLAAAAQGQDLLVSARFGNNILRFDASTGAFKSVFATGNGLLNPNGIAIGPDGNLYAGLGDQGAVVRVDGQTGAFIDRFVSDTTGTFHASRGLTFGPDGTLYVADGTGDRILKFDGKSGTPLGVAAQSGGLRGPVGLTVASDGTIYVGGALDNAIHVYRDGTQQRTCTGGPHTTITGVELGPDGLLYAATAAGNTILRYRPDSCEYLGVFASGGQSLIYMTFDPADNLIVGSFLENAVLKIDGSGKTSTFIPSGSGGLNGTHDFAFTPVPLTPRTQQWIAGIGSVTGVGGLAFRSSLSIANRGSAVARIHLSLTPRRGSAATAAKELALAPGDTQFIADVVGDVAGSSETAGLLAIDSSEPVTVWARTFGVSSRTALGDVIPSFGSEDVIGAAAATLRGLTENAGSRTNFGAINVGARRAEVAIAALNSDGATIGSLHYTLEPHQDTFVPRILSALGLDGRSDVTLRVTSDVAGEVYTWASIVDNVSGFARFVRPVL